MEAQSIGKSQRINLGSGNTNFSDSAFRKLSYSIAAVWLVLLVFAIFKENDGLFEKVGMPAIYAINGALFFFKAQFELSPTSKFASHFIVSDNILKIKTTVFKTPEILNWEEIKKVELGYYKIGIKDKTGLKFYPYQTRKETSIQLKRAIEDMAAQKGIEVENLLKR